MPRAVAPPRKELYLLHLSADASYNGSTRWVGVYTDGFLTHR